MHCINCGHKLDDNMRFCPACGASQTQLQQSAFEAKDEDPKPNIMMSKIGIFKEWGVSDGFVVVGKDKYQPSEIQKVDIAAEARGLKNGVVQIWMKNGKVHTLGYKSIENDQARQAIQWIIENSSDEVAKAKAENREFYCRCTVCGKIWSFNMSDLERNETLIKIAKSASRGSMVSAVSGILGGSIVASQIGTYSNAAAADNAIAQVKDYFRCPDCNSTKTEIISDEEAKNQINQMKNQPAVSAADEIKKFKELLDSGIITQEEFDTKKKQLLGL